MKKVLSAFLIVLLVFVLALSAGAQTQEEVSPSATTVPAEQASDIVAEVAEEIDYSAIAKQVISYIQSGEAPQELIDAMIAMGEEMQTMKEDGYTFKERVLQLITAENILATATAFFLVVAGVILFLAKKHLRDNAYDAEDTLAEVRSLKTQLKEEHEKREAAERKAKEKDQKIDQMLELAQQILSSVQSASKGSIAVARMTKDVFLNSRTIDADGKALLTHNFLEAIEELSGGNDEKQDKV